MKPSIGRFVHYILTTKDAIEINHRRIPGVGHAATWPDGAQAHVGNKVGPGEHLPMLVCLMWAGDNSVNGQVFLDGNDSLWRTSVKEGEGHGTWHWPERVEG